MGRLKFVFRVLIFGVCWFLGMLLIGYLIFINTNCLLKDILFIEGLVLTALGLMSSVRGNPMGLAMNAMAQIDSQYEANLNLEVTKMERERLKDLIKDEVKFSFSGIVTIVGGIISMLISYMFF